MAELSMGPTIAEATGYLGKSSADLRARAVRAPRLPPGANRAPLRTGCGRHLPRAAARRGRVRFLADELVDEGAESGAGDRGEDVEPERVQVAADDCRPDRPGRVHRGARDRSAEHRVEGDG